LVLAPLGRDAPLICKTLGQAGFRCTVCPEAELEAQLPLGVGVLLLSEEALTPATIATVKDSVETQPDWSDLPLVLLVNELWQGLRTLSFAGAVTVLTRPTRIPTLVTVVRAALTARRRQYQVRDLLGQQADVNAHLEARVADRTAELRTSNAQLKDEIAEHEKAKHDLVVSEGRFEKAFRVGPIAASITTLEGGRFIDVNESFEKLTGYSCEEAVGKTDQTLAMWASADDRASMMAALRGSGSYHNLELHIRTKEGDTRAILASAESIEVNDTPCLLHMFYDITERKQTEGEMLQAINEVMQDAAWFSRSLMEKLAQVRAKRAGNGTNANGVAELTKREKQVLEQMARGRTNAAIAADLGLAEQTVRNYITNLYEKIGVHSRTEAVVWARERGLGSF
jgi:PAS domain S-box-containing protein